MQYKALVLKKKYLLLKSTRENIKLFSKTFASKIKAGNLPYSFLEEHGLKWLSHQSISRHNKELDPAVLGEVFRTPKPTIRDPVSAKGFFKKNGDYVLIAISSVQDASKGKSNTGKKRFKDYGIALAQHSAQLEHNLYQNILLARAKVKYTQLPEQQEQSK